MSEDAYLEKCDSITANDNPEQVRKKINALIATVNEISDMLNGLAAVGKKVSEEEENQRKQYSD